MQHVRSFVFVYVRYILMHVVAAEALKLQKHLNLLREEYVKLQNKYFDLEKKHNIALAVAGKTNDDSFVCRLLKFVAELFNRDKYSDIAIVLETTQLRAHKFVLAARSDSWGVSNLLDIDTLEFEGVSFNVGCALLKWVYTDQVEFSEGDTFTLELMMAASRYQLKALIDKCEKALMTSVNVRNCIKYYTTADEISAESLKEHCSDLISNHWDDFTSDDFAHMSAPLLYKMFKTKTEYPLHASVKTQRDDVVFLYLIEFNSMLPDKLNEADGRGDFPLDLALQNNQLNIAETLLEHGADVGLRDKHGRTLLHKAILRKDVVAATFLVKKKAPTNERTSSRETPLHLVANANLGSMSSDLENGMMQIAKLLLQHGSDPNAQDEKGRTVLHTAMMAKNKGVFLELLQHRPLDLELRDDDGSTVLWYALQLFGVGAKDESYAASLIEKGSSVDAVNPETGDCLLHLAATSKNIEAGFFLIAHGSCLNLFNKQGETPLHVASLGGLETLVEMLLKAGANPNLQTAKPSLFPAPRKSQHEEADADDVYKQTPLHLAIINQHEKVIEVLLDHKTFSQRTNDNKVIVPNFNVHDSRDQTPLGLALLMGMHKLAQRLLAGGASVNVVNVDGLTLLHQAIINQNTSSSLFLLNNGSNPSKPTSDNETPLQLAIRRHLPRVVVALCEKGVDADVKDAEGNCPLWIALESGQEDIASILVNHKCDTNFWSEGPDGCYQTLLHRALDENNESVARFLIKSGCNVDGSRRPGPDGRGGEEARDMQTPLHMACAWGLESVVQILVEYKANVNAQDAEQKTPIHVAITNQHHTIIALLLSHPTIDLNLRDKKGLTPFSVAMVTKNNKAAQAILAREPKAAEQYDNRGRNFLHLAVQNLDMESILFLISIDVNVHSKMKDSHHLAPIHLAVQKESDIIVRNLILAGADVDVLTPQKQTTLHLAALQDSCSICSILLDNGVDFNAVDENGNNALHLAAQKGNLSTVRVLLTESNINAEAVNLRGQNPLHVLCQYGRENAAATFELFLECMPNYPVNKQDADGNSGLLLAYMNGNGNLCRAMVRYGACLGVTNKHGTSIFNYQVATKQLLLRLLDHLSQEPPWVEGDACLECGAKFGITIRRHHCRHCGRLLCAKCSTQEVPILKYNLNKPVRVCEICLDVLTVGALP